MLDVLRLLQELGLRDEDETLRSVGSPLIEVGYPLAYSPRLGPRSLIISGDRYSKKAADEMLKQIPEIKGVILSRGVAGVVDSGKKPQENVLLAGCDMRADISQSLFGETVIYKSQSRIHIEFSRQSAPKMRILEQLYLQGKLRDVVDGLCGPGTLGLMCVLAGAKRVVLNDAWHAGVQNVLLNLEANRSLLGIDEIEYPQSSKSAVGKEPVLVGRAHGSCEIEVYHGDLLRLFSRAKPADICLIDHFPGANTAEMERACRCCKEIVIV
jgi:ribosomal protein L35AE/L33A